MISFENAKAIAKSFLLDVEKDVGEPLALMEDQILQKSYGWVFFYNTRRYAETGSIEDMLAGNGPFIVDRAGGQLTELGTAYPLEKYLDDYEAPIGSPATG
jgi:hypothetical protein